MLNHKRSAILAVLVAVQAGLFVMPRVSCGANYSTPEAAFRAWKQATAERQFEIAWDCLTPRMQESQTAHVVWIWTMFGRDAGREFLQQYLLCDVKALQDELQKREDRVRRPGELSEEEFQRQYLRQVKDKRAIYLAGFARLESSREEAKAPEPIPALQMISHGNWARGSYLESESQRQNIDFVKSADGWKIDTQWQELTMRRSTPADYQPPKSLSFATPEAAFTAYCRARIAVDWKTAWNCLTPRLQDRAAYDALFELSGEDPHWDKVYLRPEEFPLTPATTAEDKSRVLVAAIKDKFATYVAARDRQAVRERDSDWQLPLTRVSITGNRAQGLTSLVNVQRRAGAAEERQLQERPHYFQKTAEGWRLDLPQ